MEEDDFEAVDLITLKSQGENEIRPITFLLTPSICNKNDQRFTEILKQEFAIDISTCHELEADIYIQIIQTCLQNWQLWKESDKCSYDQRYTNREEYISSMLEAAKPLAKKAVEDLNIKPLDASDVVMEVYLTREQLNNLFYRKPRTQNNIFNIQSIEPTRISLNTLSFESVLNFWWTKMHIKLPNFKMIRELVYKYNHTLVNKARGHTPTVELLDTNVYNNAKNSKEIPKLKINEYFNKILVLTKDEHVLQLLEVIFHILQTDLEAIPDVVKVPSTYRRYASPYKYVRYLYVENTSNSDPTYDLQLEEMMAPTYQLTVERVGNLELSLTPIHEWLRIECMICKFEFRGSTEMVSIVQSHFNDYHRNEPDWQCPQCKKTVYSRHFVKGSVVP